VQNISSNTFTPPHPLKTAVLFLTFNRPDTTKQVFEAIRKAKPPRLYVAADGPMADKSGEWEKCERVRRIATQVDWDCEVKTLFRGENLGCKKAVSDAISWFFESVDEGIILEDDCLPTPSFFRFCEEMLERYRSDERIFMISGDNFQFGKKRTDYSYYFSRYCHIWGWASWRRSWANYDVQMKLWPEIKNGRWLYDILSKKKSVKYWTYIFDNVYNKKIDTWDYQMIFTCWSQNMLVILPNANLVSNIGFGIDSTHNFNPKDHRNSIPTEEMRFPLSHPPFVICDKISDKFTEKKQYKFQALHKRILRRIIKKIGL
jgi:hypothetical protein